MPDPLVEARRVYAARARLARRTGLATRRLWAKRIEAGAITGSFASISVELFSTIEAAQIEAAGASSAGVARILAAQGIDPTIGVRIDPAAFAGVASDGRDLATLIDQARIDALRRIGTGQTARASVTQAAKWLQLVAVTQVQDAGRVAAGAAIASNPKVAGYYRYLTPPSCSRCAVQAGKWFKWNTGFKRHPRCDCIHLPAEERYLDSEPRLWSPSSYFSSLSASEQDRIFTRAGAKALRDGADMSQVVNARSGMRTASVGGRDVKTTVVGTRRGSYYGNVRRRVDANRGTTTRNRRPRLMPEQIYEIAQSRTEAIRLLAANGYIVGDVQRVAELAA